MRPAAAATSVPNDPSFGLQWGSLNTGQSVNGIAGTAGADDHAAQAWARSTGSRSIVIGQVDTGVDYNHPDLAANIWSNPGGVGGCPAGTHGYNVLNSNCDPMDTDTSYNGHGTHVAGIMGAVGNNATGVAGMNWSTTILPVRWVSDNNGANSTSNLITALDWLLKAQQAGVNVRVVNDSNVFIGTASSQALSDEIDALGANNILFVTAAGNTGENNDNPAVRRYPCGYNRPSEICVAASNQSDQLPSWSNYGPNTVDLAAPGDNIYSTMRNNSYGYINGTSMASPQVAGAAALILSVQDMNVTALKAQILNNVRPVGALSGLVRTGGILDVCKAMPGCSGSPPTPVPVNTTAPGISGTAQAGQTLTASTGAWTNSPTGYTYAWSRCDSGGANCAAVGTNSSSYPVQNNDVGSTLRVAVTASNGGGNSTPTSSSPTAVVTAAAATTFGTTTIGGTYDAFAPDRKRVNAYSLSQAGSVSKLSVYLQPGYATGNADIKGVIYADSNGSPGALIATSSQLVFPSTGTAGWYDLPFASPPSLTAGRYWIGVFTGGPTHTAGYRYTSVNNSRALNSNTYTSGPSNPFGSATIDSQQMSLYATYSGQAPTPVPVNTTAPGISGTAQAGQTLTASTGAWTNSPTGYTYAWSRCDSGGANCAAVGTNSSSYPVQNNDVGSTLRVAVTASNGGGNSTPTSSSPTAVVTAAPTPVPVNTTAPGISGTAQAGQTLTASTGAWTNSPTGYTYAWSRCDSGGANCAAVGTNSSSYPVQNNDVGSTLRVAVTASNGGGNSTPTSSSPTAVVTAAPTPVPVNTTAPGISGTAQAGQTLTASTGAWTNSPTGYTYAWSRCDSGGANCAAVGTNSSSYPVQNNDVGSTLRVAVTASNGGGNSTPTSSSPTAVVTAAAATTFGTTTIGGTYDAFAPDRKRVNAYSLSQAGSVSKLSVYLQPGYATGNADIKGVIYADSNGSPGALIATSSQLVFPSTGTAGWYDLPFASPPSLTAGRYWIGVFTGGPTHTAGYRYTSVNNSRALNSNTYTSGPSNPFGSATIDSQQMSLYATYKAG